MKLKYDTLLSHFAFNCNLRPYTVAVGAYRGLLDTRTPLLVGWCRLTLG